MSRHAVLPTITEDASAHAAAAAWSSSTASPAARHTPTAVTPLKSQLREGHKSGIYRLHGAGPGGANVIAKRSRRSAAAVERAVYQQVLPNLSPPALRLYATSPKPDGHFEWLFLEDAGDEAYRVEEFNLVVEWLGRLQAAAAGIAGGAPLPEHSHPRYLDHLRAGRREILAHHEAPHLSPADRDVLRTVASMLDALERRWDEVEQLCHSMPVTLVHGDFVRKNVRVRRDATAGQSGLRIFAIDWETAGWGVPAADLAGMYACLAWAESGERDAVKSADGALSRYVAAVAPAWRCSRGDVETWAHLGSLFRLLASIEWASYSLAYAPATKPRAQMVKYERSLAAHVGRLGREG